jgi:NAD(P)-dependent dehydrogenase (short-subunit alcohol dehydrogenase family)
MAKKKVLVLGGRGAIGSAIVDHFNELRYEVISVGRQEFDLTDYSQIENYFLIMPSNFDILIHSGGFNVPKTFEDLSDHEIRHSLDANLMGFLKVVRHCLPHWKEKSAGRVVALSSLYGSFGRRGRLPYVMSKHALNGAVKTLAIELAAFGVLVNSVSPGYIATELTYRNNQPHEIDKLTAGIPLGRFGDPSEIAKVVEFLCSDQNTYINGHDLVVDGGYSIGGFQ